MFKLLTKTCTAPNMIVLAKSAELWVEKSDIFIKNVYIVINIIVVFFIIKLMARKQTRLYGIIVLVMWIIMNIVCIYTINILK